MEKDLTIRNFIHHFILNDIAERTYHELTDVKKRGKFTNRLNHKADTIFRMKYMDRVPKEKDHVEAIIQLMKMQDNELCYVISSYDDCDDKVMELKEALHKLHSRGLASLIISLAGDKLFLDTEQEAGPAERFVGRMKI